MSDSSRPHGLQPTRLLRPWDCPGKSTGVGCHCLPYAALEGKSFYKELERANVTGENSGGRKKTGNGNQSKEIK